MEYVTNFPGHSFGPLKPSPATTGAKEKADEPDMTIKTYYLDVTCDMVSLHLTGRPFSHYIDEARHLARRAASRLSSHTDTDFARVFNVLMKTPKTDTALICKPWLWQQEFLGGPGIEEADCAYGHVMGVLEDFGGSGWRRTWNRAEADVRVYCAPGEGQVRRCWWGGSRWDPENEVFLLGEELDLEELVEGDAFMAKPIETEEGPAGISTSGQNPDRRVIEINYGAWRGLWNTPRMPLDLASASNDFLKDVNVHDLGTHSMTRLIFHEFMHAAEYSLDDHGALFNGPTAGWPYCMALGKDTSPTAAENVAMLGLWAGLADRGFTMDRNWDTIPGRNDLCYVFSDDELDEEEERGPDSEPAPIEERYKWDPLHPDNGAVRGEIKQYLDVTQ